MYNKINNTVVNFGNNTNRTNRSKSPVRSSCAVDKSQQQDKFEHATNKNKTLKALVGVSSLGLLVTTVILGKKKFAPKQIKELSNNANNLAEEITKYSHNISPIKNEEEYNKIIERLKQIYKRDCDCSGKLYDRRSGRDSSAYIFAKDRYCPNELEGLVPYCGKNDISRDINVFLNNEQNGFCEMAKEGSYKYSKDFNQSQLIDIDSEMAKDYIKCLDYSLGELDKTFGKHEGLVYRGGLFNPNGHQYYSTSNSYCRTQINCQRGHEDLQFHIIKTKNGHKIYEFQSNYGSNHFAENEKEILLPKDTHYENITDTGRYATEKLKMAEAIYKDLGCKYSMEDILSKIKIWEEI